MTTVTFTDQVVVQHGGTQVLVKRSTRDEACDTWMVQCPQGMVTQLGFFLAMDLARRWVVLLEDARLLAERAEEVRREVAWQMKSFHHPEPVSPSGC